MHSLTMTPTRVITASSILAVMCAAAAFVVIANGGPNITPPLSPTAAAYKQQLKSQVDNASGKPRSGRDPAGQQQTSLALAASSEHGSGMQTDTPAAGLTGSNRGAAKPSDVYGDPSKSRINDAGCYIDYGIQGQECLPESIAMDGMVMCEDVVKEFPKGIKVVGTDRFGLDTNHDGIACGPND